MESHFDYDPSFLPGHVEGEGIREEEVNGWDIEFGE